MTATGPFSRKNPFPARLAANRLLSGPGSEKETRHFELDLSGSGLAYECGDSLGVFPENCPDFVAETLEALKLSGEEPVAAPDGTRKPLREALLQDYNLGEPSKQFLQALAERCGDAASEIAPLLDPARARELEGFLEGADALDFLRAYPAAAFGAEEFVATLRKLQPRLYSIASSQRVHPDSVHLTVATVRYRARGREKKGVASTFLADRVGPGDTVPVFVHSAKGFRMPEDGATPMIMVGPGTGIAPFRAFLQDRRATGATGKNWLFFGEQRRASDALYGEEFEAMVADGLLTRFDTAYSRDQPEKIYVQHRMLEQGEELWRWIDAGGASIYVCGDAKRMAKDVEAALLEIAAKHGGLSPEAAAESIEELRKTKRYRRDVY